MLVEYQYSLVEVIENLGQIQHSRSSSSLNPKFVQYCSKYGVRPYLYTQVIPLIMDCHGECHKMLVPLGVSSLILTMKMNF